MDFLTELGIERENPGACAGPGAWLSGRGTERLDCIAPARGETIATVNTCMQAEYEQVIGAAQAAFRTWREVPAPKRGDIVRQIGEALRDHKTALGNLVSHESGKIRQEGEGEVQEMIDMADFAVGQARMLYGRSMHSERPQHRMYEQWHPLGITGVITAFNFPVAVWAWNAFIAAIAGNTVVWKPSPQAALCAVAIQHICNRVLESNGLTGIFNLFVSADTVLAKRFVADPRVPLVSFTGSTAVGRQVASTVAARLGRSILELSGNNAVILDESADLDLAVPAILFGAVGTAGQRCTTTRRLIVHESRYREVVQRLVTAYAQVQIGDPLDTSVLMGPLISARAVDSFVNTIGELRDKGGEILYGGETIERPGFFVEPTLARAENDWPLVQRETFAPILYVLTCRSLDEAIALNNEVPQGLSSALFTNDLRNAERFLAATGSDCGIANVNIGTSGAEIGGAFGGEKATGGGREAGSDAWQGYMRRQTNTINWGRVLPLAQGIRFQVGRGS